MTLNTFAVLVACVALTACGRRADETAKPAADPTAAAADTHKEDANTVEVDEGMLRDLRITTRAWSLARAENESCSSASWLSTNARTRRLRRP